MHSWGAAFTVTKKSYILRKTIEGYLDSFPSLTFNTINTKLIMHAFHSSSYLQPKWTFDLSHASMIKVQYKWYNPIYWKVTNIQKWFKPILSLAFHNDWLQNHRWLSVKSMTSNFVVVSSVLLPICCHIGWSMPYLCIFVEECFTLFGASTDKWV